MSEDNKDEFDYDDFPSETETETEPAPADDDDADGLADYRATRKQLREQAEALHEIYRLDKPE
jgi:hypothetical protein